jgi:hypothetical protein
MSEKEVVHFIEFTVTDGEILSSFHGSDFSPYLPVDAWQRLRVLGKNKNNLIDEIIAKLVILKD